MAKCGSRASGTNRCETADRGSGCALGAASLFPQGPVIRVEVRLVRLLVTVKDSAGELIGSLDKQDFTVTDTGVRQDLAVFERHTEQPLSISVLVDTSASTAKDLRYETESVGRFLRAVFREGNPGDAVSLYAFNYDVARLSSFTRRLERLEQNLRQLKPEGGTSLYDAIYLASSDLEDRDGRHVMVVVTDGGDTTSAKRFHDALRAAQSADAVFYSILVMPITNDAGRNIGGENALATLAEGTGGRVFYPTVGSATRPGIRRDSARTRAPSICSASIRKTCRPPRTVFIGLKSVVENKPGLRVQTRTQILYGSDQ